MGRKNEHEWGVVAQWRDSEGHYHTACYCELCKRYQVDSGTYKLLYHRQYDGAPFLFAPRYVGRKDIPAEAFDHPNDFDLVLEAAEDDAERFAARWEATNA